MSRKKGKSKAKGSAKSTPHRASSKRQSFQSWPAQQDSTPKLTLSDEARWASSHRSNAFEAGKKLRHHPIQFVSAGHLEGTIKEDLLREKLIQSLSDDDSPAPSSISSTQDNTEAMAHMAIRSPSPAASDASSSSDEVVFQGRDQAAAGKAVSKTSAPLAASSATTSAPELASTVAARLPSPITEALAAPQPLRGSDRHRTPELTAASTVDHTSIAERETQASVELSIRANVAAIPKEEADSDADSVVQDQFAKRRGGRPAWEGTTTVWEHRSKPNIGWLPVTERPDMNAFLRGDVNPRDAAMDDYMQNVEEFGLTGDMLGASGFARREMDLDAGSHNDWESVSGSQQGETVNDEVTGHDSWDSDLLQDFEDLSTSSDVMDTVVRILSKRIRKSGLQYLCVYQGSVADDARWLPLSFLKGDEEKKLVRAFEDEAYLRELQSSGSESTDESEDSSDDDEELDDETIARVLQKQEELGLGSDEVLLYGGDDFFDFPTTSRGTFSKRGRPNRKRQARGRGKREAIFPSASAMVDALAMDPYGGFDIMDTERPSLKPKKKGRRGQMPPELDDSDLNEQLQNAWEADRAKKRLKKAQREELRQQGLLGRKGKSADLKVKYRDGMDMTDVVDEIREFILGEWQSLSLPPMDSHRRATIHQAAKFFDLSSRSRGDGRDRFTVLSRTSRTRTYTDDELEQAMLRKGFLKRLCGPLQGRNGSGPVKGSSFRSGPRARPQVGYRDGDKVGANAPELGPDNRGHSLMMKMGWSKGMALGSVDNQGILQPIAHTVKINKAGLQ
ncbi:hypothetical protein EK21DRAFT_104228 [Setomelanomma holmii]|uniref:Protein SQS1 n=1 Tax=Setomelanomma holmii TaxID=210430 RepID=A0A9P4H0G2_9PLEO|nr:hypothetical protein EK21DRAFT_104228 [Setomelanomma holmii]